jgi:hypothetical protein
MIWAVLILMIAATGYIETNVINWVFLTLNLVNFGLIIRGNKSLKSLKTNQRVVGIIKFYSMLILLANILFIVFVGATEKADMPMSNDQRLKRRFPTLYSYLKIIGFRTNDQLLDAE